MIRETTFSRLIRRRSASNLPSIPPAIFRRRGRLRTGLMRSSILTKRPPSLELTGSPVTCDLPGNLDCEGGPFIRSLAGDEYRACVHFYNLARDRKTQAQATELAGTGTIGLPESVEN